MGKAAARVGSYIAGSRGDCRLKLSGACARRERENPQAAPKTLLGSGPATFCALVCDFALTRKGDLPEANTSVARARAAKDKSARSRLDLLR